MAHKARHQHSEGRTASLALPWERTGFAFNQSKTMHRSAHQLRGILQCISTLNAGHPLLMGLGGVLGPGCENRPSVVRQRTLEIRRIACKTGFEASLPPRSDAQTACEYPKLRGSAHGGLGGFVAVVTQVFRGKRLSHELVSVVLTQLQDRLAGTSSQAPACIVCWGGGRVGGRRVADARFAGFPPCKYVQKLPQYSSKSKLEHAVLSSN